MGRPRKVAELKDLTECNLAMGDLLLAITDIEILEAERAMAMAAASAKFEDALDDAKGRKLAAAGALESYYYTHVTEIEAKGQKFVQLPAGRMGRRDNPPKVVPLNRKWTWGAIAAAVRVALPNCLLPAKEREIDRNALKDQDAATLQSVGLKVEKDETFYAEPERPAEVKA